MGVGLTLPGGDGDGSGGRTLGPEQNTFGTTATANRAAAEVLRNTYAGANAAWLAQYNGNREFLIHLVWATGDVVQRRNLAGNNWEDAGELIVGQRGPIGPAGPTPTGAQIAAELDTFIGNADWRSQLSGADLVAAIDAATGSNVWRTAHTALRTAQQVRDLLDGLLGTGWREGGGGTGTPGGSGITLEQATDAAGTLLATLSQFTYNASTNTLSFAISANSITAAQARATSAAHRNEWLVRLQAAQPWNSIALNTPIVVGKIVEHGDAYFGCINNHNRSGTGPDGDAGNWILLSNWAGDWSAKWYPPGSFVRRAGLPWVATSAVVNTDPAPDAATNVKWLQLGSLSPTVVTASANTAIPASARGNTYINAGSSNITYTLPAASGGGAVPNGWEIVISNRGAGDLTIDGNGSDAIDGEATLVISDRWRAVRIQKVANGTWAVIADTKQGSVGADLPAVVNVSADAAIPATAHGDTYRVTGSTVRTITLPDPDDVPLGFFVRIANGSAEGTNHNVARQGAGQTIEGGNGPLAVPAGEVVSIQKINSNEWEIITDTGKAAAMASMASGDSRAVPIHAANVALANANYVDAGFDWPETIPYLLVQWNPAGRRNHGSFAIIYNPRIGRYPGDPTGVANAAVGDTPGPANSIGFAVPFAISAGREVEAAQASFGKTVANRALIACSDSAQDPTPLVVLAIVPADMAGTARSTVIQAAVPGSDTAGVSSITLPANYATYKTLTLVMWDHSGDKINSSDFPVAILTAQTEKIHLAEGFVADIDWNPTTRQIDHTEDRIIYAELHDGGASAGLDQDARDAAAAAQTAATEADAKAVAAQLSENTVITINKPLVAGVVTGQNLDINIEHPIGAYADSNTIALELRGRTYYGNSAYNPNLPRQTIQVGLDGNVLTNLNDNNALDAGDFVWAILRFQTGTDAASSTLRRNINIPVVAGVPTRFRTAVGASPAVLPVGTETIAGHMTKMGEGSPLYRLAFSIDIEDIPAVTTDFWINSANPREQTPSHQNGLGLRLQYVVATRTLTYSALPTGTGAGSVGSIRAKGFS